MENEKTLLGVLSGVMGCIAVGKLLHLPGLRVRIWKARRSVLNFDPALEAPGSLAN